MKVMFISENYYSSFLIKDKIYDAQEVANYPLYYKIEEYKFLYPKYQFKRLYIKEMLSQILGED